MKLRHHLTNRVQTWWHRRSKGRVKWRLRSGGWTVCAKTGVEVRRGRVKLHFAHNMHTTWFFMLLETIDWRGLHIIYKMLIFTCLLSWRDAPYARNTQWISHILYIIPYVHHVLVPILALVDSDGCVNWVVLIFPLNAPRGKKLQVQSHWDK